MELHFKFTNKNDFLNKIISIKMIIRHLNLHRLRYKQKQMRNVKYLVS